MSGVPNDAWARLWTDLAALQRAAKRLRHLSQEEPLLQPRAGYPRAGMGRSHAGEVRDVLDGIVTHLEEVRQRLPGILPEGARPPGIAADEGPRAVTGRVDALIRLATGLRQEAFQPLPPLPPVTPPYLVEPPGHDLAGTKAVLLALGIDEIVAAVRNAMLAVLNGQ